MRIALIAEDPSFGNCVGLYKTLSLKHQVTAVFKSKDKKRMWTQVPCNIGFGRIPTRMDRYIIIGAHCFIVLRKRHPSFLPKKGNNRAMVILTDSLAKNNIQQVKMELRNYKLLCQPNLAPFYKCEDIYYHPFEYHDKIEKNESVTISHSPFNKPKHPQKGTEFIKEVTKEIGVDLDVIEGVPWVEAIKRKSKTHIFIDTVIEPEESGWSGVFGKSGLEGMATECLTMTSGVFSDPRSSIPPPPVVPVTPENLKATLQYYIEHEQERRDIALKQRQWVEEYLNYEFQSKWYEDRFAD